MRLSRVAWLLALASTSWIVHAAEFRSREALNSVTGPVFVIGSADSGLITPTQDGNVKRVDYEALSFDTVAETLAGLSTAQAPLSTPYILSSTYASPRSIVVYVSNHLTVNDLGGNDNLITKAFEDPSLSIAALPYVSFSFNHPRDVIASHLPSGHVASLACPGDDELDPVNLASSLAALVSSGERLIVVCSTASSRSQELAQATSLLSSLPTQTTRVLLSPPSPAVLMEKALSSSSSSSSSSSRRRSLLGAVAQNGAGKTDYVCIPYVNGKYSEEGKKCATQVKVLEGVIVFIMLFGGVSWGTMLLGWLQAPTRFESSKDHKEE